MVVRFENCSKKKKKKPSRGIFTVREKHQLHFVHRCFCLFDKYIKKRDKVVLDQSTRMIRLYVLSH